MTKYGIFGLPKIVICHQDRGIQNSPLRAKKEKLVVFLGKISTITW